MTVPMDPNAALQALMQPSGANQTLFPPTSRYHGVALGAVLRPDGTSVVYLRRRFIPSPERYALLQEYIVVEGDRLDLMAARFLGDPEQYWRICDANSVLGPDELEEQGAIVRITLPEGIPAPVR